MVCNGILLETVRIMMVSVVFSSRKVPSVKNVYN